MDTSRILWESDGTRGIVVGHRGSLLMVGDTRYSLGTQHGHFRALEYARREGQILPSLYCTVDNLETTHKGQVLASGVKERHEQEGS
jgi:hypothetical protein